MTKMRPWRSEEDERLLVAVGEFGLYAWGQVANYVNEVNRNLQITPLRTKVQCSQRWHRVLNPSISKDQWTSEENRRLLELVNLYGKKNWVHIAKEIGNRSDVQCRYNYQKLTKLGPLNMEFRHNPLREARPTSILPEWDEEQSDVNDPPYSYNRNMLGFIYDAHKYRAYKEQCQSEQRTCALCQNKSDFPPPPIDYTGKGERKWWFTVDHKISVNSWKQSNNHYFTYEEARIWYNNTNNWQPAHWGCNSSKGG